MNTTRCIRAGWLLDGSGAPAQTDMLLTIEQDRIAAIVPCRDEAGRSAGVDVVDHGDAILLPPLVDAHLHLAMSGTTDQQQRERQLSAGCDELAPLIDQHLRLLANHGVLAVRDGGDRDGCVLAYLHGEGRGSRPVLVQSPGAAWHRQGRYGTLIGAALAEEQELAAAVARADSSPRFIKVVNSGLNSLTRYGRQTPPQFPADDLARLVALAGNSGRKVMVHANGEQPVREAVEAGCHSIEHGFFMGRDNLARMAERGCVWVATACTMKAYGEIMEDAGDMARASIARKNLDHQLEQLRVARELGVTIALGTDAGSPGVVHGEAVAIELSLLLEAGYTPAEAIHAATCAGARLMGIERDSGMLAPGRCADFLVVQSTPGSFSVSRSRLRAVYRGGRPVPFWPTPEA